MKLNVTFFVCSVLVLASCSPRVTSNIIHKYPKLESLDDVLMLDDKEPLPADAEWMGTVDAKGKVGYDRLAELTRFKAWEEGASYVMVNSYGSDGVRSDVHAMNSSLYRADTVTRVPVAVEALSNKPYEDLAVSGGQSLGTSILSKSNSFRVFAGYGRRLNKVNPSLNDFEKMHTKRLMNGIMLGADYVHYFNSSHTSGFGVRYQIMHGSSSDYAEVTFDDGSPSLEGLLEDKVNISYVGPIYSRRDVTRDSKNFFMYDVGFGVLVYRLKSAISNHSSAVAGTTTGITLDFNYSHMISDNLSIGAALSFTSGTLTNYTGTDYFGDKISEDGSDKSKWEGLLHMGICAQLVYVF